jgi:spore maturation protein CgeB
MPFPGPLRRAKVSEIMRRHLIIGGGHPTAVGNSLRHAAITKELPHEWLDYDEMTRASRLKRAFCWRILNKRPPNLHRMNREVVEFCMKNKCSTVICAGNLFLTPETLQNLGAYGISTAIWLTDDPWNPLHLNRCFLDALSNYEKIFTPRRSNFDQLNALLPGHVHYLPFGYDTRYFAPLPSQEILYDVFFAGGADRERASLMGFLLRAGLKVGLYGAYWDRFAETRGKSAGYASPEQLSPLIASSRVSLCLVRRSNRDGHSMRTFEIGAIGSPMLAEDTSEHREILGGEGHAALYFRTMDEMLEKILWMIDHPQESRMMGARLLSRVTSGGNSYEDRLNEIVKIC